MRGFLRNFHATTVNNARKTIPPNAPPTIAGIWLLEDDAELAPVDCAGGAEESDVTTVM
jgi:hypothetical protein